MAGVGHVWQGGMYGREACMAGGVHGRGVCVAGDMHGRGHAWWGDVWQGASVAVRHA